MTILIPKVDRKFLDAALSSHDDLKASGAFLIGSGEARPPQEAPTLPAPPAQQPQPPTDARPIPSANQRTVSLNISLAYLA